ncbi:hypothetical protein GCM10010431_37210 [Streptomyces kunmingensis]
MHESQAIGASPAKTNAKNAPGTVTNEENSGATQYRAYRVGRTGASAARSKVMPTIQRADGGHDMSGRTQIPTRHLGIRRPIRPRDPKAAQ